MIKLVTLSLVAVPVLTLATSASAETRIGLLGGVNVAGLRLTPAESGFSFSTLTRPTAGVVVDVSLNDRLSLLLEPMFLGKGSRFRIEPDGYFFKEGVTGSYRLSYLELPVLFRVSGRGKVQPYVTAGPTVGYLLGASVSILAPACAFLRAARPCSSRVATFSGSGTSDRTSTTRN